MSLQSLRGKVVVVNFWASWCVGCQDEAVRPQRARGALERASGVVFLGLDAQDLTSDARSFARAHNVRYPLVHAADDSIKDRYGVTGFPETFVIGRNGRAVYHLEVDQLASAETLDSALDAAPSRNDPRAATLPARRARALAVARACEPRRDAELDASSASRPS